MNTKNKILLSPPHQSGSEMRYIQEAFDSNWLAPGGLNVHAFEKELGKYVGVEHVALLNSGTAAIHLALMNLGVKTGDFVLCQSLTFVATANPIRYQGATPVFIDSEAETWNICPNALEDALKYHASLGKMPKAVIAVHLFGMPFQLDDVLYLCNKYGVPLIEDAAEALGSSYDGKMLGSFGEMGILSFNGNKIITTTGGGALLSDKGEYYRRTKYLSAQAREDVSHYEHCEIGYNYSLSNVCAGIGRGQLEVIDSRIAQRRKNYNFYKEKLGDLPGISFQLEPEMAFSNRWLTSILINSEQNRGISTEYIRLKLSDENIESRPLWKPMHMQPVFNGAIYFGETVSENLFRQGLCLPSGSGLTLEDLARIVGVFRKCYESAL